MPKISRPTAVLLLLLGLFVQSIAQPKAPRPQPLVSIGSDGKLVYVVNDKGDRVPDFSYCGYRESLDAIPMVPIKITVPVMAGDATERIQAAIDYVGKLPVMANGFRGAVLLEKGVHEVAGSIKMNVSGVVLRGCGDTSEGTVLKGTGLLRETLVRVVGANDRLMEPEIAVVTDYVPANGMTFEIQDASALKVGDHVRVHRPSTEEWIKALGTDHFGGGVTALGWKAGSRDIYWDRQIVKIEGKRITLNAPITTAIDKNYGGGFVARYHWNGRINNIGIENICLESTFEAQNPKDEAHRWMALTFDNVVDGWVRQATFHHFAGSAVAVYETGSRITVEDCSSDTPVSEIGGQRRYTFFTMGGQCLFQRLVAHDGYHDFSVGYCAPGPNAFVQCQSVLPHAFSGAIDSWASGVLFDVVSVDGNALCFRNRTQDGNGAGWGAANSMFWQCSAARIDNEAPPTAMNYAFGCWAQFSGQGYWYESNSSINPRSLYYAQLADRLGKDITALAQVMPVETEASSSPSIETANELTKQAYQSPLQLIDWIGKRKSLVEIETNAIGIKSIDQIGLGKKPSITPKNDLRLANGWLANADGVVTGNRYSSPWWTGSIRPDALPKSKAAVTRYVPGRVGLGLTDDLNSMTDTMVVNHVSVFEQNYALWYDRRRDDHERIRRMDGEVWPPFYEVPFARSGKELAWDGLSKYDLTTYNSFYFGRLKQFADLGLSKGLVLVNQHYFQHNILEAGAHYVDFPWRTANNINNTGFPEPPPFAGDKRIFIAEQFYDVSNPQRRELHRQFIRHQLEVFKDNPNVIHFISEEFTGPLPFVQFWVDEMMAWEKETGIDVLVGLSVTKDVQDAILADSVRSKGIDIIDIRYWSYRADGSLYAPEGGQNLAPRQHMRLVKPGSRSFEQVYAQVLDYRERFAGKAVVYSEGQYDKFGWASLMAGGSLAVLPKVDAVGFANAVSLMKPSTMGGMPKDVYVLSDTQGGCVIYNKSSQSITIPAMQGKGKRQAYRIDPQTGKSESVSAKTAVNKTLVISKKGEGDEVIWVRLI
jgi:hypothetical protein